MVNETVTVAEDPRVGYQWLAQRYGVESAQPLPVTSEIGTARRTVEGPHGIREIYPAGMRPQTAPRAEDAGMSEMAAQLRGHLTFAFKHEGIHLEFLSRLFDRVPVPEVVQWLQAERTGRYARMAGFYYEWLSGRQLPVEDVTGGNYVDALDPEQYFAGSGLNHPRWRVRDNLPGTRDFCPVVRRTARVRAAEQYDCEARLDALNAEFGQDVLMRSAVWLTIKESLSSFKIEHEQDQRDRVRRFAAVMEARVGEYPDPLALDAITELQREIVGDRTTIEKFGLRESPVFVGARSDWRDVVHYVAPPAAELPGMMAGLSTFLARTQGMPSLVRASTVAFGFVFVHPLADGNGRTHRFLVNDILRRDGAVPRPFVLPISAAIVAKPQTIARYDQSLEAFSKPLMARYAGMYAFTDAATDYPDGIRSNFVFAEERDALHAWRYPDLTRQAEYLHQLVDQTITQEMRNEADYLRNWDRARSAVKNALEGPDEHIDRIIRAVRDNQGRVSNKLAKEFPILQRDDVAADVVAAVREAFPDKLGAAAVTPDAGMAP
ncbi:Fic family protein [Cupriavidus sp. TMH.W2]|uniref:Fic family protein n=1 Tax=Cupriavidus sp. TMH.W2 TaxID=3434465 RepID=UPI003D775B8D